MRSSSSAILLLLVTLTFGVGNTVQKSVLEGSDPWTSLVIRSSIACIVLLPFAITEFTRQRAKITASFPLMVPVFVSFAIGICCQILGASLTSATNLGFLVNLSVVFTPVLTWLCGGGRPQLTVLVACVLAFAGATLLSGFSPSGFGLGDILCLGAAIAYSVWIIQLGRVMEEVQAPGFIISVQWVLPAIAGLLLTPNSLTGLDHEATSNWPAYFFLGAFASGAGYMIAAFAQARMSACAAAIIYTMEGVFGAGAAMLWLGETLTVAAMIGAALTIVSVVLVECGGRIGIAFRQRPAAA